MGYRLFGSAGVAKAFVSAGVALALCATSACSEDGGTTPDAGGGGTGGGGTTDGGSVPGENGYILCGTVFSQDGIEGYVSRVDSLDASTVVDIGASLPVPPGSSCVGNRTSLFVGSGEAPEVVRYDILDDGSFAQGQTVSFMNLGVTAISRRRGRLQLISDTKAFYVDDATLQVIVWNPSTMEISGSFSLDAIAPGPGEILGISNTLQFDGSVVSELGYLNEATNVAFKRSAVMYIDVSTDAVEVYETDACGGTSNTSTVVLDGFLYIANGAATSGNHRLGAEGSFAPCMVRFDLENKAFDDGYIVSPSELTGQPASGELARGPDSSLLMIGYDETVAPITDETTIQDVMGSAAWQTYQIADPAAPMGATLLPQIFANPGAILTQEIGNDTFIWRASAGFADTTLVNINDINNPVDALKAPGIVIYIQPL